MDDEVFKDIGIVAICLLIAAFTLCAVYGLKQLTMPEAKAKPVTTEIPEYVAKCSKRETTRNTCIEFTIYRITRN